MKKTFFSAAIIASCFAAFAFNPIEKKASVDNSLTAPLKGESFGCTEYYETNTTFSKCYKVSSEEETISVQKEVDVLSKF
jgi:hypothetical protein